MPGFICPPEHMPMHAHSWWFCPSAPLAQNPLLWAVVSILETYNYKRSFNVVYLFFLPSFLSWCRWLKVWCEQKCPDLLLKTSERLLNWNLYDRWAGLMKYFLCRLSIVYCLNLLVRLTEKQLPWKSYGSDAICLVSPRNHPSLFRRFRLPVIL